MATYVVQRKESSTGNLDTKPVRKCGVSILTNQKNVIPVSDQVFNYFGMHKLFDTGAVAQPSFRLVLSNALGTLGILYF